MVGDLGDVLERVPVVAVGNLLGSPYVASQRRPGGNLTGISNQVPGVEGKKLELLKELAPGLERVAVERANAELDAGTRRAAASLGLEVQPFRRDRADDLEALKAADAIGVTVPQSVLQRADTVIR